MKAAQVLLSSLSVFAVSTSMAAIKRDQNPPNWSNERTYVQIQRDLDPEIEEWLPVITFTGGFAQAKAGSTQTILLAPQIQKRYIANGNKTSLGFFDLFFGYKRGIQQVFETQLGVAGGFAMGAKVAGDIWDDANPAFNNLRYNYKISHSYVAVKGKLLLDLWPFKPYVNGSVGPGFNKASSFNNTPKIFQALPNPNFTSKTMVALSYTVGVGVEHAINDYVRLGIGYEYADWGRSRLGPAPNQTLNTGLKTKNLQTNGIALSATYLG